MSEFLKLFNFPIEELNRVLNHRAGKRSSPYGLGAKAKAPAPSPLFSAALDGGGDDAVGAARREKSSVFVWEVTSERRE